MIYCLVALLPSDFVECLREIVDDVVDVFRANREADGRGRDVLLGQFLGRELRVGGGVGMDDEALHVGHVGQQREYLQCVDELPGLFLSELVVAMALQCRMVHLGHLRMAGQEADHLERILHVALHAQAQRLNALQQDEGIER